MTGDGAVKWGVHNFLLLVWHGGDMQVQAVGTKEKRKTTFIQHSPTLSRQLGPLLLGVLATSW